MIHTREEGAALLERRVTESGLSTERFAVDVMIRQARTIRRWLDRSSPIPNVVLDWLQEPKVAPWPPPALLDVPEEDRERFAEEVGEEIAAAIVENTRADVARALIKEELDRPVSGPFTMEGKEAEDVGD